MKCGHTADEHAEIIRERLSRTERAALEIEAEAVVALALQDLKDASLTP